MPPVFSIRMPFIVFGIEVEDAMVRIGVDARI